MKQGGEINVLDAKPIEIDSDEMSKYCRVCTLTMKTIFVTTYLKIADRYK